MAKNYTNFEHLEYIASLCYENLDACENKESSEKIDITKFSKDVKNLHKIMENFSQNLHNNLVDHIKTNEEIKMAESDEGLLFESKCTAHACKLITGTVFAQQNGSKVVGLTAVKENPKRYESFVFDENETDNIPEKIWNLAISE